MPELCESAAVNRASLGISSSPVTNQTGTIVKVRLTEYYPFHQGLTPAQRLMEGGTNDRKGKRLQTLEDYIAGNASYVSLACDFLGGAPGNRSEFKVYGYRVRIPALEQRFGRDSIEFRLVDTGGHFYGNGKEIRVAGYEPIDVCRSSRPSKEDSFSGLLTELFLIGPVYPELRAG